MGSVKNKTITKYEFDEKYVRKNTVVHCQTKELAEEFLRKADEFGYTWWSTDKYIGGNYDHKYEKDTCYNIVTGKYNNIDYYRLKGFNIIEFDGFKVGISQTGKGGSGYKSIGVDELEQMLGVKFYLYQKLLLKMFLKTNICSLKIK